MSNSPWPEDYRCAACFTFDLDANESWNRRIERDDAWDTPPVKTRGNFGPETAVPRILDLFDRYDLDCTFFVPGKVAEDWPDTVTSIYEAGHEIGHHGYHHVNPSKFESRDKEEQDIKKAFDIFDDLIGDAPVGYRSPACDFSNYTMELLVENGIRWESSFIDSDIPYLHDENIIELPFEWSLDDFPYFGFQMYPQLPYQSGISPTGPVFDSWRAEFEGLYKRKRLFMLTMHPQVIGRAGRMDALEDLLQHMISKDDTWITTGEEIAEFWRTEHI